MGTAAELPTSEGVWGSVVGKIQLKGICLTQGVRECNEWILGQWLRRSSDSHSIPRVREPRHFTAGPNSMGHCAAQGAAIYCEDLQSRWSKLIQRTKAVGKRWTRHGPWPPDCPSLAPGAWICFAHLNLITIPWENCLKGFNQMITLFPSKSLLKLIVPSFS